MHAAIIESAVAAGLNIRVLHATDSRLSLSASIPGESLCAGMALFSIDADGTPVCDLVHVDEKCRLRGVASALFDYAEQCCQRSAVSGMQLTQAAVDFYKARGMSIPAHAQIKTFHEWFDAP